PSTGRSWVRTTAPSEAGETIEWRDRRAYGAPVLSRPASLRSGASSPEPEAPEALAVDHLVGRRESRTPPHPPPSAMARLPPPRPPARPTSPPPPPEATPCPCPDTPITQASNAVRSPPRSRTVACTVPTGRSSLRRRTTQLSHASSGRPGPAAIRS